MNFNKVIKTSLDFDQAAWDRRIHWEEYDDNLSNRIKQEQTNKPKCPYCGSNNTAKIGEIGKVISIGVFGLASNKIGKQWHCNNCGSDF